MESEKKIKVFISSICESELKDFDQVANTDKAISISYNLIRRALKVALTETGIFEVYVFEDELPSTSSAGKDYLDELDNSDVCIFLIDNFHQSISEGLLTEITRAQKNNQKSFYLFLNHTGKDKTSIQENLKGVKGAHYFPVNDIREFIDKGYRAVINDIIKIYQRYCDGKIDYVEAELPSIEITEESFPMDTTDIDKQIFKNLGLTKNKIVSLVYRPDEKNVQTSELDELSLAILEVMIGEKEFKDVDLASILKTLSEIQSPKLHKLVSQRWEVIANLYKGDLDAALTIIETAYNTYSEDASIPKWLINDILIDWSNIKTIDVQIKNIAFDFSVQEKINQQDSLIFFPLVDRFSTNINNDIWDRNFKIFTSSPYSTTFYNFESVFGYISNYLFAAIYYGSYTHMVLTLREIQKTLFDIVQKDNNLLRKLQLMRISVLRGDESSFNKIIEKYGSSLSHNTTKEILDLYKLADTKPLLYEKMKWKTILFRELGYYFSDIDYETISNEILVFSREWLREENINIFLIQNLIKALKSNIRRLSQEDIIRFAMEVLNKKYSRFFDSIFEILNEIDIKNLSKELVRNLLLQINVVLEKEDKKGTVQKGYKSGESTFTNYATNCCRGQTK